ncbi:MAG: putative toxin-antitoxin system toxin component, PIN family [Deltaproteobacteria bacterium]|nr:putative toxin-antitoxin system toxin component, PIN family [Deltaproteobacteria bacterium]
MRIVLDTNVLISALAFPNSKPDRILSCVRRGEIELCTSTFILAELERILREKFGFSARETTVRVRLIRALARLVEPTERVSVVTAKDDDNRIVECALAAQADYLVTGDKKHLLPLKTYLSIEIVSPAQFLDLLEP